MIDLSPSSGAVFSDCRRYRFLLWRRFDTGLFHLEQNEPRWLLLAMLNPSDATEFVGDRTVDGCEVRAKSWGFSGLIVVNQFAFRSPYPKDLLTVQDPIGELNDQYIRFAAETASVKICGWGNSSVVGSLIQTRTPRMVELLGDDLKCLKMNQDGSPAHPLYIKRSIEPIAWSVKDKGH